MALDPYRDWLQIPAQAVPPNHYQLLGLDAFEPDPGTIQDAYGRQMEVVRRYQVGQHMEVALRVIAELSKAYTALIHPREKEVYDRTLRGDTVIEAHCAKTDVVPAAPVHEYSDVRPAPSVTTVANQSDRRTSAQEHSAWSASTFDADAAWRQAAACLGRYLLSSDVADLGEGEQWASRADPRDGRTKFVRLALQRQIRHKPYEQELAELAETQRGTICGACFQLVPPAHDLAEASVAVGPSGSLYSDYISIQQKKFLFWIEMFVESHRETWSGPELGTCISKAGALWIVIVLSAIPLFCNLAAGFAGISGTGALSAVLLAIGATWVIAIGLFYHPRFTSALDAAWEFVTPHLLASSPSAHADAFIVGLASFSERRGSLHRRQQILDEAVKVYESRTLTDPTMHPYTSSLQRLQLADFIMRGDSKGITDLLQRLMWRAMTGQMPVPCLDRVTQDAVLLASVFHDVRIMLRWHLYVACENCGLAVGDVLALRNESKTLALLLDFEPKATVVAVSHAYAIIQAQSGESVDALCTVPQFLADADPIHLLRRAPDAIAWCDDGTAYVSDSGLFFKGHCYTSPPSISVQPIEEFVQTGWKHQRNGSQPDRRYKNNPPVGYTQIVGHLLKVGEQEIRYGMDLFGNVSPHAANRAASTLTAVSNCYFSTVRPLARQIAERPRSTRYAALQRRLLVKCPHCRRTVRYRVGAIGEPADG